MTAKNRLRLTFNHRRTLVAALLLSLFVAFLVGGILTRGGDPSLEFNTPASLPSSNGLVDQTPLRTARALAAAAAVPQEQQYAQEALQLSDSEVDQAFAAALRNATEHAAPLTGQALKVSQRIAALNARVHAEQLAVAVRSRSTGIASPQEGPSTSAAAGDTDPQLQLDRAQLALDSDELDELHQTLLRLGGDRHAMIQQALDEHEAVHKQAPPANSQTAQLESTAALVSLPGKLRALQSLRDRQRALNTAQREATALAATLMAQRDALAHATEQAGGENAGSTVASPQLLPSPTGALPGGTLAHMHALASDRQSMAQLERRIRDERGLAEVYGTWSAFVVSQQRTLHHRILRVLAAIVFVLLLLFLLDAFLRTFFGRHNLDWKRAHRMRFLLSFGLQFVGALVILLLIFGAPRQTPTIIGLATAGFTVVMKDFIVAFFGWFVLMGRNGVHVGDWVEINGVGGEVVDIGMLRTTLLETGNWAESGRPTGRRVAFMNSYAIEGHFFNFSTTGQWMWEELRISLPADNNAYAKAEAIRDVVVDATREQTKEAEAEWAHATRQTNAAGFSAQPTIDMRPGGGIELIIRYITRAQDRHQMRSLLYPRILAVLHGRAEIQESVLAAASN
ncbi:MAG: mechanosensitive ion channel domain-containing protein [Acidobacteriaceae bacterium]